MNDEIIHVLFNDKLFKVRRKRYIEILENTVQLALPEEYLINSIKLSKSSESAYISVISPKNNAYFFRISSHRRTKGHGYTNQDFNTNDYVDFTGLKNAIHEYLKATNYIRMEAFRYLALDVILSITTQYREISLGLLPESSRLRREIKSFNNVGMITINGGIVGVGHALYELRDKLKKRFSYKDTRPASEEILKDLLYRDITQTKNGAREFKEVVDKKYNVVTATQNKAQYQWYIPKYLRGKIQIGDEIIVMTKYGISQVVVDELSVSERVDFKPIMQKV